MAEDGEREADQECGNNYRYSGAASSKRCAWWMPKKRRFCATAALPASLYCGNHRPFSEKTRVTCPVDPSHTVLEADVTSHVKKCSATKQLNHIESQSYFCRGVNAGSDEDELVSSDSRSSHVSVSALASTAEYRSIGVKRAAINTLTVDQFHEFVKRIERAHEGCDLGTEDESFLQPPQCSTWWNSERDRRLPFQEKHVSQQASLLGNLEAFGLLQAERGNSDAGVKMPKEKSWIYVEFGAGRGYLSHMLCDSYEVSSVVLVERRAYKFKAERTLRQNLGVSVERLRTDIEDLIIQEIGSLKGRHFVAVSKHLCGPATDLTLRCCLNRASRTSSKSCDMVLRFDEPTLEGFGIATCCHHLCQWRSYVNKTFFRMLGFSRSDFDMITWLTSWAVNQSAEHVHQGLEGTLDHEGTRQDVVVDNPKDALVCSTHLLDVVERAVLGRKCKELLDHGRLLWLQHHGFEVKIVKYIPSLVTPENKLLLARRSRVEDSQL